jgi:hypothetical protein
VVFIITSFKGGVKLDFEVIPCLLLIGLINKAVILESKICGDKLLDD